MATAHFKTHCLVCHTSRDFSSIEPELVPLRCLCGTPVCITRIPETSRALPPATEPLVRNRWNVTDVEEILADLRFPVTLGG
jgi:hypothetical protein